ncbi:MAG: aldehyde dehydrogenase family protein [Flavitalea sp.]
MKIINPATEEVIAEVHEDTEESVKAKYKRAKQAQVTWRTVPIKERITCIQKFHDFLESEKDELAKTLTSEMGKSIKESYSELLSGQARIRFFIENSEKYLADEWITENGGTKEKIVYEPLGVITNISAWNYPYLIGITVFIPALIAGNAVLYKPSEYSTLTGMHIQSLFYRSGIPESIFETVIGKGNVGEYLLNLPLDGYFFTGSYKTGKYIAEKVAPKLVRCQLELGGKDPMYIMDDVEDIKTVAEAAVEGVVYNNGQSCCAIERIYVHEKIYDEFLSEYLNKIKKLKAGDPLETASDFGPLCRKEQVSFLFDQIDDAVKKGAKLVHGGEVKHTKGYYFEPAVLVNVNHDMKLMMDESFGPVIGIQKVKNDEEATELMLDTPYGLTASVYSASYDRADKVMKNMHTGTVYWNCCERVSASLPWSGRRNSGLGSTLSYHGIRAFTQLKAYHLRS